MALRTIFLVVLFQIYFTKSDVIKSSLTFVIDDTGSMSDDIAQVRAAVNLIFDAVVESKYSQIENFVLVTFNDPDVRPATVTRDRDTFKQALDDVVVDGGIDCPEYSMSGIESALNESLPGSYLYVFTDASASDYSKFEQVKSLAQKKSSQIVFVLTGRCNKEVDEDDDDEVGYVAYHKLAHATSGQVFHLEKTDVGEILKYIIESIKGRTTIICTEDFEPGYGNQMTFTTDVHIPSVLISVAGRAPKIAVTDHEGKKPIIETIIDMAKVTVLKVLGTKPGVFTAEVGSESQTSVVISGRTTIDFQHGFSTFMPTCVEDTVTRPELGASSYILIQLSIVEGVDVVLTNVIILGLDGETLFDESLEVINEVERLYVTHDPIEIPNNAFQLMMVGYSVEDNSIITRKSATPMEPHKPAPETKEKRAPKVSIDGAPKIIAEYDEPLELSCKITGYPKPDIIWQEENSKTLLPFTVTAVKLPYEYISILEIEKVNRNSTYVCRASNSHGDDTQAVSVEVPVYFNVLETPIGAAVKHNTTEVFSCIIDARPPATITWYKNNVELSEFDDDSLSISSDGSVLTILHMEFQNQGYYECNADNGYMNERFKFVVAISGVVSPKIDKHVNKVRVKKGSHPELMCRVTEGTPAPKYIWYYRKGLGKKFHELKGARSNSIKFKNINIHKSGVYKCIAYNEIGYDEHDLELVVEYRPKIKKDKNNVIGMAGKTIILKCNADAIPPPLVQWTKDDILIKNSPTTRIFRDHSLKLLLSFADSGTYKCVARNRLGRASKTIKVDVCVPATIESPIESLIYSKVGEDINLVCYVEGYPTPYVKWITQNKLGISTKTISLGDSTDLYLPRVQLNDEGFYTCVASNSGGSFNITYEVKLQIPPKIVNEYQDKTLRPVKGDSLMIKCNPTGSPKPVITWRKDGLNIASGTSWYDIDEHGTLFITNVDAECSGTYECLAENVLGRDVALYYIAVDPYPKDVAPTSFVLIEEGSSNVVECSVSHNTLAPLRWYKDGKLVARGELLITDAKLSDSGVYVCRVSDFTMSRSGSTKVEVGYKPRFTAEVELDVELVDGSVAELLCTAEAIPAAKTTWWLNGNMLNITTPENIFYMTMSNYGNYTCEVTNEFGQIQRTFNMRSNDCILDVKEDFTDNQPLIFTDPLNWPAYEVFDGRVVIPKGDNVSIICPESFTKFPEVYAMAFCEGGTNFNVDGNSYKYSDLKCTREFNPNVIFSGYECLGQDSELFTVEFEALDGFLPAYDICFDRYNNISLYAKHYLDRHLAGVEPKNKKWFSNDLLPLDFDEMYDCHNQEFKISNNFGTLFHASDKCCFSKRQLINSRDMIPGLVQASTFSYFNVVPHWTFCGNNNWDDLEQKLRELVKLVDYPLTIWTGTADHLKLPDNSSEMKPIYIYDGEGRKQPVPLYLWKVVQDPVKRASLAIVQVNIPNLSPEKALKYVQCADVCAEIPWMQGSSWHDVTKGYTYCCNIQDFQNAFGYHIFKRGHNKVFLEVSIVSEHYLT